MELIRERYEPLEVVGKGGQGEVIRALDRMHSRLVAVKVRYLEGADEGSLISEGSLLLGHRPHPGLPLLREDFFEDGRYYLVMDWVEGSSLAATLGNSGPMEFDEVLPILEQVAAGLDHLHSHDPPIVHGDVKPANVIVGSDGRATLVDLGVAAHAGFAPPPVRSAGYAAPEAAGGQAKIAGDVFALAATAFALLTGSPPRPGATPDWKALGFDRAKLVELSLSRGLAFDPSRRPHSAGELVESMRPGAAIPNNLRLHLTPFIGRESELAEVAEMLGRDRLVTLAGIGGLGKTRLAERVAAQVMTRHPDGVHFADLSSLTNPKFVEGSVAAVAGAEFEPSTDPRQALLDHLRDRRALIVLDNCEHVLGVCARLAEDLLAGCIQLRILATSREPLGLPGEAVFRVPVLSTPSDRPSTSEVIASDAGRLFVDRAERGGGFRLTDSNAADVALICRRLEGIPLAIELAASRSGALGAAEVAGRLGERLPLLAGGSRTAPARQQSLRAAIDWSYELLTTDEAALFRRLSVFAGGFTAAAAESVAAAQSADTASLLAGLAGKSLISREDTAEGSRFRMFEAVGEYAREKLIASPEGGEIARRHLEWACEFTEERERQLGAARQTVALRELDREHDNFRAALAHARTGDQNGLRLAAALWRFWEVRGHLREGLAWVEEMTGLFPRAPLASRARGARAAGTLALGLGNTEAASGHLSLGARLAREVGDMPLAAACLNSLAIVAGAQSDAARERRLYEQTLAIWRELGHDRGIAVTLGNLGTASLEQSDFDAAERFFEESLEIRRRVDDAHGIAACLNGLAVVATSRAAYEDAAGLCEQAIAIWTELGYRRGVAVAQTNRGLASKGAGDLPAARGHLEQSIETLRDLGAQSDLAEALEALRSVARAEGNPPRGGPVAPLAP